LTNEKNSTHVDDGDHHHSISTTITITCMRDDNGNDEFRGHHHPTSTIDALYGGPVLVARGKGFVVFWDREAGEVVRRIDVEAKKKRAYFPLFSVNAPHEL